jgi:hypothetical protein
MAAYPEGTQNAEGSGVKNPHPPGPAQIELPK